MRLLGDLFFMPPSFCAQAEASLVLRSHNYFTLFLSRRHATPIPAFFRSYPARDKLWALRVTPCVMSQKKKGRKRETHPSRCKSPMVRWSILVSSNSRAQNVVDNFPDDRFVLMLSSIWEITFMTPLHLDQLQLLAITNNIALKNTIFW